MRVDLSTPQAQRDAATALPGLVLAGAMGNADAARVAGAIIGQTLADALQPSVDALNRLAQENRITR